MRLEAGARIGPYEIVGWLGAGGMGEVYRARDSRLARDVAIKVLPESVGGDPSRLRRFEQEARAAGALNHSNVLVVHDIGFDSGVPYIVSELLEGESLRERLRGGAIPVSRAVQYGSQIARGLAAAHAKGIVHRDLKPENLLLTRDGRVKILDFGLAKLLEQRLSAEGSEPGAQTTQSGVILGTVGYMSPEQARGEAADHRADIFSFGTVLYEVLAQRRAFEGGSAADVLASILKEEPPELPVARGVPPGLERIVRRCLEKDPEHRFQSAHDLAFALEALSGSSASVPAVSDTASSWRVRRVVPVVVTLLALLAAGFLAGRRAAPTRAPAFQKLTFRHGAVMSARYAPDGQTVVYAAAWDGDPMLRLFSTRVESPESTRLELPEASVLGISRSSELALALKHPFAPHQFWTGTLARVPLAGGAPRAVLDGVSGADWSRDGNGFAIVRSVDGRSRLEYPPGNTLFEAEGIWHPRVSPDGERVAFFHGTPTIRTSLAVCDRTGRKTELSPGWKWSEGLTWSPNGREVWFTASKGNAGWTTELYAVSLAGSVRLLLRLPAWMQVQDVTPDGRVLGVLGTFRVSSTCLPPGETRERDVSWRDSSFVLELSEDGKTLLFSEQGGAGPAGALFMMKTTESAPPVRLGEAGIGAGLSPDGRWAAVKHPTEIVLLPTGAGEPRRFSTGNVTPTFIRFFRDGKRCLLTGREPGRGFRTYSLDVETGRMEPLGPEGLSSVHPSPDGAELLMFDEAGSWTIYSLERRESRPAPGILAGESVAAWAADGGIYVEARGLPGGPEIHRVDPRTGERTPWRRIVIGDPAGLVLGTPTHFLVAPAAGAYCYTAFWHLFDLYQITGIE